MNDMNDRYLSRRSVLQVLGAAAAPLAASGLVTQPPLASGLESRIRDITQRPHFVGATWAMCFQAVDAEQPVYALNPSLPMTTGSTMKVFIAGTAYQALRPSLRFRTRVYRTGPVTHGVLEGDLVLEAGGDLLLGGRVRPDGSLALPTPDHSYGGDAKPIPGDPLRSFRDLAVQVAAHGVWRVEGSVLVDVSLFRQGEEQIGNGVRVPISPIMANDNIVDVVVTPGAAAGQPASLRVSPRIGYVEVVCDVMTIARDDVPDAPPQFVDDVTHPDGTHTVRLTGSVAVGAAPVLRPYFVPDPQAFARMAFVEALRGRGIRVAPASAAAPAAGAARGMRHGPRHQLGELVSPPLSEAVKPMLKLSSNPHTAHWPYLVGAIAGREYNKPVPEYERMRDALFRRAGLDPDRPGSAEGKYSPGFFVQFLAYLAGRAYLPEFRQALPVMGRDGTLAETQVDSPAAGHVHAKTGTTVRTRTNGVTTLRGLAGYIEPPSGRLIAFAAFTEQSVASTDEAEALLPVAQEALGEIATAVYESSRQKGTLR